MQLYSDPYQIELVGDRLERRGDGASSWAVCLTHKQIRVRVPEASFGCDVLKSGLWWVAGCEEMVVGARCSCGGLAGEASLIEARGGRRFIVELRCGALSPLRYTHSRTLGTLEERLSRTRGRAETFIIDR